MAELTTVADIKLYAGITGSTSDALLATLLESAEASLRQYCSRPDGWARAAHTETLDGRGVNTLLVRNTPVAASPAPAVAILHGTTSTTAGTTSYRYEAATGEFRYIGGESWGWDDADSHYQRGWPSGFQNITIEYTGGYAVIPADLAHAAIDMTLYLYHRRQRDLGLQSEALGAYSYTLAGPAEGDRGLPLEVRTLVDPYRRVL